MRSDAAMGQEFTKRIPFLIKIAMKFVVEWLIKWLEEELKEGIRFKIRAKGKDYYLLIKIVDDIDPNNQCLFHL